MIMLIILLTLMPALFICRFLPEKWVLMSQISSLYVNILNRVKCPEKSTTSAFTKKSRELAKADQSQVMEQFLSPSLTVTMCEDAMQHRT